MTLWRPDPTLLRRPAYLSLADQIGRAIHERKLKHGDRLPPHRRMADDLKLSVQTVSRAYEELIRRGLISGEIGRGSFVQTTPGEMDPPYIPERLSEVIDLSILKPVCEALHLDVMKQTLLAAGRDLPATAVLSFRPNVIFPRHAAAAATWLESCGLEVSPQNITVTNGASAAMSTALMSVAPAGSTVVAEATGHHTLVALAKYLGFHLEGLATDRDGLLPTAFEKACAGGNVRALFLQPTVSNPSASLMSLARRRAIIAIARKHDVAIVESDVLGPLITKRPPPVAALAPERTLYITGFTKITVPGLRIAYLAVPDRYVAAVTNRHLVTNWMATPLMSEIASRWVEDGTALRLVEWQRDALRHRHAIVDSVLSGTDYASHPESLHVQIPLGDGRTEDGFVAQARLLGVAVAPGHSFRISKTSQSPFVRISLGSTSADELHVGLGAISRLLLGDPEILMPAI